VYSRNIYNGHCMRQVALSTYTSLSLFFSGILGCSLSITQLYGGPLLVVWWQGQAARTTRNSSPRTFVERNVAKEPKSSQIENFGPNCFSKEPNFWFLAPKEPIWQPCAQVTNQQQHRSIVFFASKHAHRAPTCGCYYIQGFSKVFQGPDSGL